MITLRKCEDQEEASERYWRNELAIPEKECDFEVPAGMVIKPHFTDYLVETTEPLTLHVDARGKTNYDNQRQAFYGDQGFWIKGQFLTEAQKELLSRI